MGGIESHEKGSISESKALTRLKELGYTVSIPWGRPRYDFVVENGSGELLKVQVKSGNLDDGVVKFECRSSHINSSRNKHMPYTKDEVDVFLVYCGDLDELYWVPFEDAPKSSMSLRVEDAEISHDAINWANEYKI